MFKGSRIEPIFISGEVTKTVITKDVNSYPLTSKLDPCSVVIESTKCDKIQLKREIGFLSAFSIIVGAVIGSGIFISPVAIIRQTHSVGLALVVWLVSGVLMTFMALCYVELAMIYPRAGGDYAYMKAVNGNLVAFLKPWIELVVVRPCAFAIMAMTSINYMLVGIFGHCETHTLAVKLLSCWVVVTMVLVNSMYMRYVTTLQTFLTSVKIISLSMIIISGIYYVGTGHVENFVDPFKGSTTDPGNIAVAIFAGMYSYGGWQHMFSLIEEIKQPTRLIPRVTCTSMILVMGIYIMTNAAYLSALSPSEMANTETVAMGYANVAMGKFAILIPFMVACSTIGSLNCTILGGSRLSYAAARDGLFPRALALINIKYITPWLSIWSLCCMSILYIFFFDPLTLVEYQSFVAISFHVITILDVIYLRIRHPEIPRTFKVWIGLPIIVTLSLFSMIILGLIKDPLKNGISLFLLFSGVPVYLLFVKGKTNRQGGLSDKFTLFLQKLLLVVQEDS